MMDMVPKSITYTLVNHSKDGLQQELLQELYKPDVLSDLMKESDHIVARRKEVVTMIQALNKAEECVSRWGLLRAACSRCVPGSWLRSRLASWLPAHCVLRMDLYNRMSVLITWNEIIPWRTAMDMELHRSSQAPLPRQQWHSSSAAALP
jgi:hypothetical protein